MFTGIPPTAYWTDTNTSRLCTVRKHYNTRDRNRCKSSSVAFELQTRRCVCVQRGFSSVALKLMYTRTSAAACRMRSKPRNPPFPAWKNGSVLFFVPFLTCTHAALFRTAAVRIFKTCPFRKNINLTTGQSSGISLAAFSAPCPSPPSSCGFWPLILSHSSWNYGEGDDIVGFWFTREPWRGVRKPTGQDRQTGRRRATKKEST